MPTDAAGCVPARSAGRRRRRVRVGAGGLLCVLAASATVTTPLWPAYEHRLGHGPDVTTLVFGICVLTLLPAALASAAAERAIGLRRLVLVCPALAVLGCLLLWHGDSVGRLAAGRLLQGLGVGMASGPLTAALLAAHPPESRRRVAVLSTALITAGAGTGPVLSGALAGPDGAALGQVYGATVALLLAAGVVAAVLPARLPVRVPPRCAQAAERAHRRRPQAGSPFWTGALVSLLAWTFGYTVLAVSPSFAAEVLHSSRPLVIGAPAGLLLLLSAATQPAAARLRPRSSMRAGCLLVVPGLLGFAGVAVAPTLPLLTAALAVVGTGHGLTFLGALRQSVTEQADSATTGRFFAVTYAGGTAPVLALGVLAAAVGVVAAVVTSTLTAAATALAAAGALRAPRPDPPTSTP